MNYLKFKKIISTIVLASSMTLAACAVPNVPEEGIQVTVDGKVYTVKNATEEEAKNPSVMDITTDGGNIEVKTNNEKKDFTVETGDTKTETKTESMTTDG